MKDSVDYRIETLRCPYCHYEIDDACEIEEGECQTMECPNCGKEFEFNKEISVVYTTFKVENV